MLKIINDKPQFLVAISIFACSFYYQKVDALELAQEPPLPTSKSAFVAPNVILSIDDSGSMDFCLNKEDEKNCVKEINNNQRGNTKNTYYCEEGWTLTSSNNCRRNGSTNNDKRYQGYSCSGDFIYERSSENCIRWHDADDEAEPINGIWPENTRRMKVLKNTLTSVISNREVIPHNKIRLAWQSMNNKSNISNAGNVNSASMNLNSMRPIDTEIPEEITLETGKWVWKQRFWGATNEKNCHATRGILRHGDIDFVLSNPGPAGDCNFVKDRGIIYKNHRQNFIDFVTALKADGGTPSHRMLRQADDYMRRPLSANSPWSSDPGANSSKSTEYLGCRRNYHILLSDGRWTTYDQTADNKKLNTNDWSVINNYSAIKPFTGNTDQTYIYSGATPGTTLADLALKSWILPLQNPANLKDSSNLKPSKVYADAPATKTITASTNSTKTVNLQKYWDPEYNPATWPHMVTYTIGFSEQANTWPGAPDIIAPTEQTPFGYNNGFTDLVTGAKAWPAMRNSNSNSETGAPNATFGPVRSLDLWQAAINGRGRFYAVNQAQDLEKAFKEIIGKINEESAALPDEIAGGGSTSGYNVSQNNAGIFASVYSPKDHWSGFITATRAIEPEKYSCPSKEDPQKECILFPDVVSGWGGLTTADRLDALNSPNDRQIITWSDQTNNGIAFKWKNTDTPIAYSQSQIRSLLNNDISNTTALSNPEKLQAKNIINYVRGDRSLENSPTSLRKRHSRHGDVVNSEIWYTGSPISNYSMGYSEFAKSQQNRTPILYVGANDGMLHGFSAIDGSEKLAYIPRGVISNLRHLADKDYEHLYYVDGSPMTGDIKDGDTWKTMLVGTLGAGGKGYFLLDVTDPTPQENRTGFSESKAATIAVADRTFANDALPSICTAPAQTKCLEDRDIGNITSHPGRNPANLQEATQITRMNNGRWAVLLGNGYNSANERPVLLVQYLDQNRELVRIQTTNDQPGSRMANDNGLASPALVDLNGDGKTDIAYAGDNLGNVWKFDLTSPLDTEWKVAFGGTPLFTARGPSTLTSETRDQIQPITAAPIVRANDRYQVIGSGKDIQRTPVGGMMVAFGTGRNITEQDRRTDVQQSIQTLYSVQDNTRYRSKTTTVILSNVEQKITHLEVHPGESCSRDTVGCMQAPAPVAVGTLSATGAPLAKQVVSAVEGDFGTISPGSTANNLNQETWKNYKGWYLDFPAKGERLLKPMQFFDGSNILAVYSETPAGIKNSESDNINESCVPVKVDTSAGSQFRTFINIMDGKMPTIQLIDYNRDGKYDDLDFFVARAPVKTGTPILITKRNRIVDLTGGGGDRDTLARMPENPMRPSWRQLK